MVEQYVEVILDEVPEISPRREVDFSIDLFLGVGLVYVAPYQMAPAELIKFKKQIKNYWISDQVFHHGEL